MKHPKPQSLTTDTRLSQSNFFNSSLLNKTNITSTTNKNHLSLNGFNNNKIQNKQADFLKVKNLQLQQRIKRMTDEIKILQENKVYLLRLNQKYVKVVNQYYRDQNNLKDRDNQNNINQINIINDKVKVKEQNQNKGETKKSKSNSKSKYHQSQFEQNLAEHVLTELEKDHRNLVKHCLVMENEIKNYAKEMQKFTKMKDELLAVNHTTPKQLINELKETTDENKQLKKQNNRLSYELQKMKMQNNKLKKARDNQNKQLNSNNDEAEKLKAEMIKVTQQSNDKANQDQQKIYQLQLKVQKLQKQLRMGQQQVQKHEQKRKTIQIQRVQSVHQNSFLRANLSELLDPKKHPLLSLDRSFVYKKKKQPSKRISLNCSVRE